MRQLLRNVSALTAGLIVGVAISIVIQALAGLVLTPSSANASLVWTRVVASASIPGSIPYSALLAAHALGALCGAATAARMAASHALPAAIAIGFGMLALGIASVLSAPAPNWFQIVGLNLAYLPMAWIGWRIIRWHQRPSIQNAAPPG